ncbi:unnamed protein product [Anisakis simplex]|uniref:Cell division cycle protein 16 homolog (inferred by orthology to a human protein) n=1 Tax=Anisakis simplex TaxID=6269 RepID=A0A0M3J835_ANISI|nr:unnamed protein product [Anisakis simplex]
MYIGLQYSYANNTKLALDFLNDAAISSGENALVLHEQGCIHYMMKQWESAEEHFTRALKLAYGLTDADEVCDIMELLWKPISQFWEPLLNNLGHTKRKLGKYLDAVKFHQKAIVLRPQKASTIGAMAVAFASAGRVDEAAIQFHNALSLSPHDQVGVCLSKLIPLTLFRLLSLKKCAECNFASNSIVNHWNVFK